MSSATITAAIGPDLDATALPIAGVTKVEFDFANEMLTVYKTATPSPVQFALTGSNTITLTASSGTYTLTVA